MKRSILLIFGVYLLLHACTSDETSYNQVQKVNQFIQVNMDHYYYWTEAMPDLDPVSQPDPNTYFKSLLYTDIDRWSLVIDDYKWLLNYFDGKRKEAGYSLRPYTLENNPDQMIALIEYVEPGGPADRAGLKRGDIIVKVNGASLNADNYSDLLRSEPVTIGLGSVSNGTVTDMEPSVKVTAEELTINPILCHKVFEKDGKKGGYLAYTSFINNYNDQLLEVFSTFKSEGISDLILDLRYNSGGSVASAKLMAEMIAPTSCVGKTFLRYDYNAKYTKVLKNKYPADASIFNEHFTSNANNLDLQRLYVLTTVNSASASEMVIYSLFPYMDVVQIGETTHGKYYGMVTIYDEEADHDWAILPVIMRAENSDNSLDYSRGLPPNHDLKDDYSYALGSAQDVLTAFALDKAYGSPFLPQALKAGKRLPAQAIEVPNNTIDPLNYEMYMDQH